MMIFKKIRWKNFLSTGQHKSEMDFTSSKTNLIVGKNSAGKCVRGSTEVDIMFEDEDIEKLFLEFIVKKY